MEFYRDSQQFSVFSVSIQKTNTADRPRAPVEIVKLLNDNQVVCY